MNLVKLKDIFKIESGGTPSRRNPKYYGGDIPWAKIRDIDSAVDGVILDTAEKITSEGLAAIRERIFPKGTLLLAMYGSVGKVAFCGEKMSTNQAILGFQVLDSNVVSEHYVFYWFKANQQKLKNLSRGGILKNLSATIVKDIEIPLPSLKEQNRIVYLLSKVDRAITQRKVQLNQLDELLGSVFYDMFGEPVRNEKQWNQLPLGKLLSNIDSGWSPKCEAVPATNEQWGVLKLGAVTSGFYKPNENKAMLPNVEPKTQHEVKVGDLLFTRKNTYELVAATAFVHETPSKLLLPDLIFRLVIKDKNEIHPIYLWKLLSYPSLRKKIQSLAGGAAGSMPNISKANLKTALLPVPSIELQLKFVEISNKIEAIKNSFQNSLNDLELLYVSLSQKAFEGELDLSAVPLSEYLNEKADQDEDVELAINQIQKKLERITKPLESLTKPLDQIKSITRPIEQIEPLTKPLEQIKSITRPNEQIAKSLEAIILPKVIPDFSKDKTRRKWIIKLLEEFLMDSGTNSFSLPDFWEEAQNWIGKFEQEDGESLFFSIDDYEVLKDWLFIKLRTGMILQVYQEASNSIKFKVNNK